MTRFNLIDPDSATGKTKLLLEWLKDETGTIPDMALAMANSPVLLESYMAMENALKCGVLSPRLRAQLALMVAEATRNQYALSLHNLLTQMVGMFENKMPSVQKVVAPTAKEEAALKFAGNVVRYKGYLSDVEFNALRQAGYTDQEIAEIIGNIVLHICTNYFNRLAQINTVFSELELMQVAFFQKMEIRRC
jgi:alkylhydroperoxidase family enzyme